MARFKRAATAANSNELSDAPAASRVLLLERDPAVAHSLALMLGARGFHVEVADDGDLGLLLAAGQDHGIVMLGPNPPEPARGGLAGELRLARLDRETRFLAVSPAPGGADGAMQITPFP